MSTVAAILERIPTMRNDPAVDSGKSRGEDSEQRLLDIAHGLFQRDAWFLGGRLAHQEEDLQGADVVLKTTVGDIWLQAKSSQRKVDNFRTWQKRGERRSDIGVVLANTERSAEDIARDLRAEVADLLEVAADESFERARML